MVYVIVSIFVCERDGESMTEKESKGFHADIALFLVQGCIATQNTNLQKAISLLATKNVSSLSIHFSTELLSSPKLPSLLQLNTQRLAKSYVFLTSFFTAAGIKYQPANGSVFVLAKLAPKAQNRDDEATAHSQYVQAGVLMSPGRAYSMPDGSPGWMRVTFALDRDYLLKGLERIKEVYEKLNQ